MNETKTMLKRIFFYYLLLAINILPCGNVIPDSFPTRNVSTIYLLALSVCLVFYYSHRVARTAGLSVIMKSLSWMAVLMIFLRGVKYSAFSEVDVLARHAWYLYYVPILLLPLFLFHISLLISPKKSARIAGIRYLLSAMTVLFIILVLTNDLHQQVFAFSPGFKNWNNDYSHGTLFYVISFWQYALYIAAITVLIIKCHISSSKKSAWVIVIPFVIGILMNVLLITGKMPVMFGSHIIEFPEALIFMVATVLDCCIQLGLIPTNTDYGKLFGLFSISAQITDGSGTPVYVSAAAIPLTKEQFALENGSRISEHTVLHKMKIPGGFGFWQDDMTELDRLNDELADAKEKLAQETELIRLNSELKKRRTKIEQRTLVYDTIAKRTKRQSQEISRLSKAARLSTEKAVKEEYRRRIIFLGAYIKRYANLTLLSQENCVIEAGELGLSVSEVLRRLNFCGIPGEFIQSGGGILSSEATLAVFEAFETLIETNYSDLHGVFVNMTAYEKDVTFKATFENMTKPLSDGTLKKLAAAKVRSDVKSEDNVTYICFTLKKGGDTYDAV